MHVAGTKYFVNQQQALDGLTWKEALKTTLATTPFRVTPPSIFMPHYTQVCDAVRKKNPTVLYDGTGEPLSRSARDELYERRTADTWVRLDARFEQREDNLWMLTDHALVNGKLQPTTQKPLESRVIREDGFVELRWNNQGMPVKKSKAAEYMLGKNIIYYAPTDSSVVGFIANSGRFVLSCSGDLQYSIAALGVLFCAEGTAKK